MTGGVSLHVFELLLIQKLIKVKLGQDLREYGDLVILLSQSLNFVSGAQYKNRQVYVQRIGKQEVNLRSSWLALNTQMNKLWSDNMRWDWA